MAKVKCDYSGDHTSDVYFAGKDDTLPITLEIRSVLNEYPTGKVLPFSRVIKASADVNVSDTAATATTFTFPGLVFLEIGVMYALVLNVLLPNMNVGLLEWGILI